MCSHLFCIVDILYRKRREEQKLHCTALHFIAHRACCCTFAPLSSVTSRICARQGTSVNDKKGKRRDGRTDARRSATISAQTLNKDTGMMQRYYGVMTARAPRYRYVWCVRTLFLAKEKGVPSRLNIPTPCRCDNETHGMTEQDCEHPAWTLTVIGNEETQHTPP